MITFKEYLTESNRAANPPGHHEVSKLSAVAAYNYAKEELAKVDLDVDIELPDFYDNFESAKKAATMGKTVRKDMPRIKSSDVKKFQRALVKGKIDINAPFADATDKNNPFPNGLTGEQATKFATNGLADGNKSDDRISVEKMKVRANELKPIQQQIYLSEPIALIASNGGRQGALELLSNKMMIASSDLWIIDGHHRWFTALLLDPTSKLKGIKIDMSIKKLLPMSLAYGDALGNERNS
ncbi:MAG: hypothetical protein R8M45_04315 [Ghiorsea sp.]